MTYRSVLPGWALISWLNQLLTAWIAKYFVKGVDIIP